VVVFGLSATSLWSLLAEFYGLCSMRSFTFLVFLPAMVLLVALAAVDCALGTQTLCRAVMMGLAGGIVAAIAYDLFRLPFVFSSFLGLERVVPHLPLFKVFPQFGAMILGQERAQPSYGLAAELVGWAYHFSNGATLGVMYLALVGDATRRHWAWAVLLAVGLELGMLLTPYPNVFGIRVSPTFIAVTLAAHLIFGIVLGLVVRAMARGGGGVRSVGA
jgi:hypothetical protein